MQYIIIKNFFLLSFVLCIFVLLVLHIILMNTVSAGHYGNSMTKCLFSQLMTATFLDQPVDFLLMS